jgi:hypothetical protein
MDWGNAHEVVGDGAFLGIPYDYNDALRFRGHDKPFGPDNWPWNECPASVIGFQGKIYTYTNYIYDAAFTSLTFHEATTILREETPLLVDIWHNELDHNYDSPRVNHKVIYLSLSGRVAVEIFSGIRLSFAPDRFLTDWARLKNPDDFWKVMKNKYK